MNVWSRFLVVAAALCAAAAPAAAQQAVRRAGAVRTRAAAPARPRAPRPPRLSPGAAVRPSSPARMPPAARFDLKPQERPPQQHPPSQQQRWPSRQPHQPEQGQQPRPIQEYPAHRAPDHGGVMRVPSFAERVRSHENDEAEKNRVYWHDDGGSRYAHSFDGKVHWYGFYNGPRFYWTRYHDNRWWWYDTVASRWLYWHDNYWWWNNPANPALVYVDVNDSYYPYADVAAVPELAPGAAPADSGAAVAAAPAANNEAPSNMAFMSKDGTREVQIYGARQEAFLYDRTGGTPRFIAFLAAGVRKAKFSDKAGGGPLQILLLMADGSFDLYDENGKPLLQSSAAGDASTPPGGAAAGSAAVPAATDATTGDPGIPPSSPGTPPPPDSSVPPIPAQ